MDADGTEERREAERTPRLEREGVDRRRVMDWHPSASVSTTQSGFVASFVGFCFCCCFERPPIPQMMGEEGKNYIRDATEREASACLISGILVINFSNYLNRSRSKFIGNILPYLNPFSRSHLNIWLVKKETPPFFNPWPGPARSHIPAFVTVRLRIYAHGWWPVCVAQLYRCADWQ
jgi:hypothetical protein